MTNVFLVQDCAYTYEGTEQILTSEGTEQALAVRDELIDTDLGKVALLLSSTEERALQTARIIGHGINERPIASEYLRNVSLRNNLGGITLGEVVNDCLDDECVWTDEPFDGSIIAVVHKPLIRGFQRSTYLGANSNKIDRGRPYRFNMDSIYTESQNDLESNVTQSRLFNTGGFMVSSEGGDRRTRIAYSGALLAASAVTFRGLNSMIRGWEGWN
jgi:hypothetical protein